MANLTTTPTFDDVYQLEQTDLAKAGPGEIMNRQAQQLANRDEFIRQTLQADAYFYGQL